MKPAMYIFINKGLDMSAGKIAAQAGHAAVEAYRVSQDHLLAEWYRGGHYAKYVMEARNEQHILNIQMYLTDRGFATAAVIDEGHTEVPPHSFTALGVGVVDKDDPHTAATFGEFKLYHDRRPSEVQHETLRLRGELFAARSEVERLKPGHIESRRRWRRG